MNQSKNILSTRKLEKHQKHFLLNAGFSVMEIDFIKINFRNFQWKHNANLLLFTSQNAVRSVLLNKDVTDLKKIPSICIGKKTAQLLKQNDFQVIEYTSYAKTMVPILLEKYYSYSIAFFGGNLSSEILPNAMKRSHITWTFYEVYHNSEIAAEIIKQPDGILFFSPSGVHSYLKNNVIKDAICFCIGTTTAQALQNITKNIVIANKQTIENTIIQCIQYFHNQGRLKNY